MLNELEAARKELTEAEQEWRRISDELEAQVTEHNNVMGEIAMSGAKIDTNKMMSLLSRSQHMEQTIRTLTQQKERYAAEHKRARERTAVAQRKVGHFERRIKALEAQLGPGGEFDRRIREAEHALEIQVRLRESAERELLGLRAELAQLMGDGKSAEVLPPEIA